ncbi:flavin-containing monooxygenase [Rhodococcus opacus]|uniref:flavin-containing monooxygenase n=1 Tax=Rhodococcus opacus TaxID=37919 RepID=UPI001C46C5F6|nr:NAD(P)/FAD-dependent oxidoreductase [Rhodococcus opacus]MBV6761583.1 NAD(P)/FAD-dependent oxidoreductase [Rhodococcus opacus]
MTQTTPAPLSVSDPAEAEFQQSLAAALDDANLPTLLAAVVQLTGDLSLLEGKFRPTAMRGPGDHDDGGMPDDVRAELRTLAFDVVLAHRRGELPDAPTLTPEQVLHVLSRCLDEEVPSAQGGMLAEELGALSRATPVIDTASGERAPHVLVVGTGFSGLCAAIRLDEAGVPYTIIDKNPDAGGTWHENVYPGCGVDTPVHLYSYSFAQRADWPRYFAKQSEVEGYLLDIATSYGIRKQVQFGTELETAEWDEDRQHWRVTLRRADNSTYTAEYPVVITAVGLLNRPAYPNLAGLDSFTGPVVHTGAWDPGIDLENKRVAVIGTGASAMQLVPAIAGTAREVTVFQRSAQWIMPNPNTTRGVEPAKQFLMAEFPGYLAWYRLQQAWKFGDRLHPMLRIDPEWPHQDRSINSENERHRKFLTRYIEQKLAGRPELIEKCVPDYPPYGKRPLLDHGWFDALLRDDVVLVDEGVSRIDGQRVVTSSGTEYEADVIVLATGFQTLNMLAPMEIHGRDGTTLRESWGADDARAYLGMTVPNFPNMFILYGPNTNAGHGGSHVLSVEMQVRFVLQALERMAKRNLSSIECRQEVFDAYNGEIDAALDGSIWTHTGMTTYYRNSKGRIVTNTPWTNADYWHRTRRLVAEEFIERTRAQ